MEPGVIGWIGTGVMGRSMCGHLLKAGRAIALYTRTCDAGIAVDCYNLGRRLQRADPHDRRVFELFTRACDGGVGPACHEVGLVWEATRDPAKALPFYEKACAAGHAPACDRARRLKQ